MPRNPDPVYPLSDKALTEIESKARGALEEIHKHAPVDRKSGRKLTGSGADGCHRILAICAGLRKSLEPDEKPDPAEERDNLIKAIDDNKRFLASNPRIGAATRRSCENGIKNAEARLKELGDVPELEPAF